MAGEAGTEEVLHALHAFRRAPHSLNLAAREPRALFDNLREVLSLAAGREDPASASSARAFLARALLRPGATHYELLGLEANADHDAIKQRYRLLMRIAHPDFAAEGTPWPQDTAARLNLAHETLTSAARRAKYDASRRPPPPQPQPQRRPPPTQPQPLTAQPWTRPRSDLRILASAFGFLGVAAAGAWFMMEGEQHGIVQRAPEAVPPTLADAHAILPSELLAPSPTQDAVSATDTRPAPLAAVAQPPSPANPKEQWPTARRAEAAAAPVLTAATAPIAPTVASPPAPSQSQAPVAAAPSGASSVATGPAPVPPVVQSLPLDALKAAVADVPELTVDEVQPLLTTLMQALESGQPARIETLVQERSASFSHFMKEYDRITSGSRSRKIVRVQFDPLVQKGRVLLTGRVWFQSNYLLTQDVYLLALQLEFIRSGNSVRLLRLGYV